MWVEWVGKGRQQAGLPPALRGLAMDQLDFVTLEGLLAYGEVLAPRTAGEGMVLPPAPSPSADRSRRAREAMEKIRAFVQRAQKGFPTAEGYRGARPGLIHGGCGGGEPGVFCGLELLPRDREGG